VKWKACRAAALLIIAVALPALATPVQDAQALISKGDYNGALDQLNHYLSGSPQDAEARFTRGLVLVKLNRSDEAIKAFSDLTRDYPQLPEPYNNLAVLYAQKGDYEKARAALEAALATHPAYATAHENLGDIYSALAGAAYSRALQLDQNNASVKYKLSLINQLGSGPAAYAAAGTTSVQAAVPSRETLGQQGATTTAAPVAAASTPTPPAPVANTPVAPPEPLPATPTGPADPLAAVGVLTSWAQAWSAKDADGYLSYYAPDFQPDGGLSRAQWEDQRRDRISAPAHISVRLVNPQMTKTDANHVSISFTQDYQSDAFSDQINKTVEMTNASGTWKIVREVIH
jgi:tetratricopeptide (TPR) repeat protein